MSMKKKDFTPKNELKSGKRLDTGMNTMKRLSFVNKVLVCFLTSPSDTQHYYYFKIYKMSIC